MYFSFVIYLCTSDRSFDILKNKYLARVIHDAVIRLAEILDDLCYYEMKLLHCILNPNLGGLLGVCFKVSRGEG